MAIPEFDCLACFEDWKENFQQVEPASGKSVKFDKLPQEEPRSVDEQIIAYKGIQIKIVASTTR